MAYFLGIRDIPGLSNLTLSQTQAFRGGVNLGVETIDHFINVTEMMLEAQCRVATLHNQYFKCICEKISLCSPGDIFYHRPQPNDNYDTKLVYLEKIEATFAANRERAIKFNTMHSQLTDHEDVIKRDMDHIISLPPSMIKRYASIDYNDDDMFQERYGDETLHYDEVKNYACKSLFESPENDGVRAWFRANFWYEEQDHPWGLHRYVNEIYQEPHPMSGRYQWLTERDTDFLIKAFGKMPEEYISAHKKRFILANLKGHLLNLDKKTKPPLNFIAFCGCGLKA